MPNSERAASAALGFNAPALAPALEKVPATLLDPRGEAAAAEQFPTLLRGVDAVDAVAGVALPADAVTARKQMPTFDRRGVTGGGGEAAGAALAGEEMVAGEATEEGVPSGGGPVVAMTVARLLPLQLPLPAPQAEKLGSELKRRPHPLTVDAVVPPLPIRRGVAADGVDAVDPRPGTADQPGGCSTPLPLLPPLPWPVDWPGV